MKEPKRLGIGATVSFQCKFIHPHRHRDAKFPNPDKAQRLTGAIVVQQKTKRINHKPTVCVIVHHDDFKDEEGNYHDLYCNENHVKVEKEGPSDKFFEASFNQSASSINESTTSINQSTTSIYG